MHYYQHHIGDFRAGTFNMTREERWIYRDMLDVYYDIEGPLPKDIEEIYRLLGIRREADKMIVVDILSLKFTLSEKGYVNERCDAEIFSYRARAEIAQNNGKRGGRPLKNNPEKPSGLFVGTQREPDGNPEITGSKANHKPLTNNHSNTPIPPKGGDDRKSAISLKTYITNCKQSSAQPIPAGDPVFEYADKVGIPPDFLRLQWLEFKERYSLPDAKRYKSWPTVFRKSVQGNWFKIWYAGNDGSYALTTVGQQATRNHKEAT